MRKIINSADDALSEHDSPVKKPVKPLTHRDAEAAAPEDNSVCGEEDPGSALESLMDPDK
ncbi:MULTISPECIES: hypothetical protein [unclassified Arsukibacterium]|uniref:hypothetical protein n=1 Tax=unclassified Arsukibacterium TaxID=2635278 RepID=UPI0025C2DDB0|nr:MULTISPECIES: hypothetical protein [unclassified Arsukibacterium]|tara:strand:- start:7222 stop:7401 length:180 start_codon:yes stop_codon:yes gene_type:complete